MNHVIYEDLGHNGRLGNQLFQIYSTLGIAKDSDRVAVFNKHQVSILDMINSSYLTYYHEIAKQVVEYDSLSYTDFKSIDGNILIKGYLQCPLYFKNLSSECFQIKYAQDIDKKLGFTIRDNYAFVHIRRGDYVQVSSYLLSLDYYINKMIKMQEIHKKEMKFFIFSDDIEYVRHHFYNISSVNITYVDLVDPIHTLFLMSLFNHGILSNSSFSWWAARLNKEKISLAFPDHWFNKNIDDTKYLVDMNYSYIKV